MNLPMESYLDHMNSILNIPAPYKKVNKYKLRFKIKPWINSNDSQTKEHLHTRYKEYENILSTLLKRSKINYYNLYFDINWKNIKNSWKGIKSILSVKINPSHIPKVLTANVSTITNPVEIANVFNKYFSSVSPQTKVNITYSHKHFSDFLKNRAQNPFFKLSDKDEITLIISSLDSTKSLDLTAYLLKY